MLEQNETSNNSPAESPNILRNEDAVTQAAGILDKIRGAEDALNLVMPILTRSEADIARESIADSRALYVWDLLALREKPGIRLETEAFVTDGEPFHPFSHIRIKVAVVSESGKMGVTSVPLNSLARVRNKQDETQSVLFNEVKPDRFIQEDEDKHALRTHREIKDIRAEREKKGNGKQSAKLEKLERALLMRLLMERSNWPALRKHVTAHQYGGRQRPMISVKMWTNEEIKVRAIYANNFIAIQSDPELVRVIMESGGFNLR